MFNRQKLQEPQDSNTFNANLSAHMRFLALFVLMICFTHVQGQQRTDTTDINEVIKNLFGKNKTSDKPASGISILPAIGYNPSFGLMLGGTVAGGSYLGDPATTQMSIGTMTAFFTTKGIINLQLRHNVFTKNNEFNFQGNAQITKMVVLDYGLGPATGKMGKDGLSVNQYTLDNPGDVYPIKFSQVRLFEKAYKKISDNIMVGAGVGVDFHFNIRDQKLNLDSQQYTPHYIYSQENGINPKHYWTNGFLLNIQYNTKEHPNRAYGGMYADIAIRINPKFLGSTMNSTLLLTEFRKYFSLSKKNPEHVLAFWHLGTYRLAGVVPYLDLPNTGSDTYNRSGRGYTIGRFRGISYFDLESEYRFPITRNKFLSGVVFMNMQTMSDGKGKPLFGYWEPGGGAGIRIFFNRLTRTNICIDYAFGKYGANGLFFGLNEVF